MNTFPDLKSPTLGDANYLVSANYNKLSDHIRRLTPQGIQCSVFCGGNNCKYENPENWKADSLAIQGIYSHWITDDILAMARPSTIVIVKKNVIQQFESLGIKSIINLQSPKEHASCGQPLEESGFSYDPNIFMENNIFYYNFAWKDYGDASLLGLLNMVKVLAFAVSEGRVAVHCHAGLGRTGVLIACYLIYSLRVDANEAIRYVRLKRPGSVQTRGQILCIRHFAQFILPKTITFFIKENASKDKYMTEFSLHRFLRWQKDVLHGYEERHYKFLPKIIHKTCERILKLSGSWTDDFPPEHVSITSEFFCAKTHQNISRHESTYSVCSATTDFLYPNADLLKSSCSTGSSPTSPFPPDGYDQSSLSEISNLDEDELATESMLMENKCFQELQTQKTFENDHKPENLVMYTFDDVITALLTNEIDLSSEIRQQLLKMQNEINSSQLGIHILSTIETDLNVLICLLLSWLESLKTPVINREDFENIVVNYKQAEICFQKFDIEKASLIEYLLLFISKLLPTDDHLDHFLRRIIASLTQQTIVIGDSSFPSEKGFNKLRDGTLSCTIDFFNSLYRSVELHHNRKTIKGECAKQASEEDSDSFH